MFAKLFQSMYDGSLATRGPWQALVTFQQLLILADRFGDVDMTIEVISRRTLLPQEVLETGIEVLLQPDPASRDPAFGGRRIVPLADGRAWGWHIVNYTKYSQIRSAEERREYKRQWVEKKRIETAPARGPSTNVRGRVPRETAPAPQYPDWLDRAQFDAWIETRPARARSPAAIAAALKKLEVLKASGHEPNTIVSTSLANGWQGIFPPDGARGNGSGTGRTLQGVRCAYCAEAAVRYTNEIAHCGEPSHLDFAIARRV